MLVLPYRGVLSFLSVLLGLPGMICGSIPGALCCLHCLSCCPLCPARIVHHGSCCRFQDTCLDWHIPGLISPAEWDKILPSWIFSSQNQDDDGKPPRTTLRFLKKQTENDQPPRSDGCWRQGWQKSGFPRNIQVRILWMNWRQLTWPVFYLSKFHQRDKIQLDAVSYFKILCFHRQQLNPSCQMEKEKKTSFATLGRNSSGAFVSQICSHINFSKKVSA